MDWGLRLVLEFISHMVQIKRLIVYLFIIIASIYIPYGSDKTAKEKYSEEDNQSIYIPYGSDKTNLDRGSDRTFRRFISHMVQIKHYKLPLLHHFIT